MLIEFKVKNFRSYKDEASLTFEALPEKFNENNIAEIQTENGVLRILKSAAILGSNASGKSNLIRALHTLRRLVVMSRTYSVDNEINAYEPFLDNEGVNNPVEMSLTFVIDNISYCYELSFNKKEFLKEHLYEITKDGNKDIITRDTENANIHYEDSVEKTPSSLKEIEILQNQLILSKFSTVPSTLLNKIYTQVVGMSIISTDTLNRTKWNMDYVANTIYPNKKVFGQLKRLLQIADVGIRDTVVIKHDDNEFNFPDNVSDDFKNYVISNNRWEYRFSHNIENQYRPFDLSDESKGTQNIFGLGARILNTLDKGTFLAYDEMNMSLHPEMFKLLISLFNNPKSNPKNAQLLFTTHDASAIGNYTMRADQIWFAQKNGHTGVSELYSVQDFDGANINMPFESWYRSGRFGVLPKFGNIDYIFDDDAQ